MMVGLVPVVGIIVWFSTHGSFSMQTRRTQQHQMLLQEQARSKTDQASPAQTTPANPAQATGGLTNTLPTQDRPAASEPVTATRTQQGEAPALSQGGEEPEGERKKIETTKFHIVRPNETLSKISQQHYGTVRKLKKILDANPNVVDANKIIPGMKLTIPD